MIEQDNNVQEHIERQVREGWDRSELVEVHEVWGSFGWLFDGTTLRVRVLIDDDRNGLGCLSSKVDNSTERVRAWREANRERYLARRRELHKEKK